MTATYCVPESGALWCKACKPENAEKVDDGGGETDSPASCDMCHRTLFGALTTDGLDYVRDAIDDYIDFGQGDPAVLESWAEAWLDTIDAERVRVARRARANMAVRP